MFAQRVILLGLLACAVWPAGCREDTALPADARTHRANEQCRQRWGKPLDELPSAELVVITPNNQNIKEEFAWAFSLHHAVEYGQRVNIRWREVGGGGASIETYLLNVYDSGGEPGIDVLWGGGEFTFMKLASDRPKTGPLLLELDLSDDVSANVPAELGGTALIGRQRRWIGTAVSGFGFLYNKGMLRACGIAAPESWDDLADDRFADALVLADPSQSGSAAAAYRMIAMSGDTWPQGWAKLLGVLSNAKRFADSAGAAANAPALGEALVATCIDFYGATRVAEAPDELEYISPRGQTVFTPDPIGILKNPPNENIARRFVEFVLCAEGQALGALPAGEPDGPARFTLGRQPIRRDVYERLAGRLSPWLVNPYGPGQSMTLTAQKQKVDYNILRELVFASAVLNRDGLMKAREVIRRSGNNAALSAEFVALPENLADLDAMARTAAAMKDKTQVDTITRGWRDFFADKYRRIIRNAADAGGKP